MVVQRKKWHPKFVVPGFGTVNRSRLPDRWRKQRGTDNKKRIARSGYGATPHVGYKNHASVRFMRADGSREVLVHNEKEMHNLAKGSVDGVVAVIAHNISTRKRIVMQGIADKAKLRVANRIKDEKVQKKEPAKKEEAPKTEAVKK
ncbi:MAG: hypothetical protein KGH49_02070 [Candidatus Micrarchaeota archaeon]|nr:hypothetical protein [Candidatus Micrarchaeota archaeon]